MGNEQWYNISNVESIDSPSLILYKERVKNNIRQCVRTVKDVSLLRPHVKTNKIAEVCRMMMEEGISKFKCATIAEAEMLGSIEAHDILLAYQPVGPKINRLLKIVKRYPNSQFSCLIDHVQAAEHISKIFHAFSSIINVYIDLNVGMNRTGITPANAEALINSLKKFPEIHVAGFHVYDGQINNPDPVVRKKRSDEGFAQVTELLNLVQEKYHQKMTIIAGGSTTFSAHAVREGVECSPGTFVFWDFGYKQMMPEAPFDYAVLILTRVISIVDDKTITVDLGYKSVSSENPQPRVHFLNAPDAVPAAHSEEHLVLEVPDSKRYSPGDVLYGVPRHICPTVALYERITVAEGNSIVGEWKIIARDKKLEF
ncbi:MAG: D-TA family PLP-dependent enzyme [Bacteroidota bacterium]